MSLWWNNLFWGSINALKYSSVCTRKYVIVVVVWIRRKEPETLPAKHATCLNYCVIALSRNIGCFSNTYVPQQQLVLYTCRMLDSTFTQYTVILSTTLTDDPRTHSEHRRLDTTVVAGPVHVRADACVYRPCDSYCTFSSEFADSLAKLQPASQESRRGLRRKDPTRNDGDLLADFPV